jgi:hypothetical protein
MLRRSRGARTAPSATRSLGRRVLAGLIVAVAAGGGWIASSQAASKRVTANGDVVTFHVVFSGSGNATSSYPPVATNTTVFTTSIHWSIGFDVTLTLGNTESDGFLPASGSSLGGVSNGVYEPGGWPIEPGCEQIDLLLDATQTAATMPGGVGPLYELDLATPGFDGGAFLAYQPSQCSNPFPGDAAGSGCPDPTTYYTPKVQLDPTRAKETWPLSEHCNIPDEGQTASWSGTVTATRTSAGPGTDYAGHTKQRCSRWDSNCRTGRLPISFEVRGGLVENLRALDEGRCNHKLRSQDLLIAHARPLRPGGVFTLKFTVNRGSFHAVVRGTVTAAGAHGTLSATGRYNLRTHRPDPHGKIVCRATRIGWTAAASP